MADDVIPTISSKEIRTTKFGLAGTAAQGQTSGGNQVDQGTMTTTGTNTGTAAAGLSLIGNTTTVDQAANLMNDLVALKEDVNALDVLLTEIRTTLVANGIMKGSA